MLNKVRQLLRGLPTLTQLLSVRAVQQLSGADLGLVVESFEKASHSAKILILAPHPDDEVFGCGGALALHIKRGDEIHVLYLADGSHGTPNGQRDIALIKQRQLEAQQGLKLLGGGQVNFWDFEDGAVLAVKKAADRLGQLLINLQPDRIYVPWLGDLHPDHRVTTQLLARALTNQKKSACEVWQYEVWSPLAANRLVSISSVIEQKTQAIRVHASQLQSRDYEAAILGLNNYRGALAELNGPAEAYLALPAHQFIEFCQHFFGN